MAVNILLNMPCFYNGCDIPGVEVSSELQLCITETLGIPMSPVPFHCRIIYAASFFLQHCLLHTAVYFF